MLAKSTPHEILSVPVHFINPTEKYLITTNYKVWFSTLTAHKNLIRSDMSRMVGFRHYFLVRNPYDRLESFYRDKLFDAPANAVFSQNFEWQNCQKVFLAKFGKREWSFEEQRQYLQSLSFQEFIELLSQVYYSDVHLVPQTFALESYSKTRSLNMQFDRILKVEEHECIDFIRDELKIDTSIKRNSTREFDIKLIWIPRMRTIVNLLFKKDFVFLDYPLIQ